MFTQSFHFFIVLFIIIVSKGFIQLNEQFLVALCFILFLFTVIVYFGNQIQASLEQKQVELIQDHKDFLLKTNELQQRLITILNSRKNLISNLKTLNRYLSNAIIVALNNFSLNALNNFKDLIISELQSIFQFESNIIPVIQLNFISSRKNIFNYVLISNFNENIDEKSVELFVQNPISQHLNHF